MHVRQSDEQLTHYEPCSTVPSGQFDIHLAWYSIFDGIQLVQIESVYEQLRHSELHI